MQDEAKEYSLSSIEDAILAIQQGQIIIVVDDEDRENEDRKSVV